jgi:ferric-dicitrate binding protein FerR (iron transport regulator)
VAAVFAIVMAIPVVAIVMRGSSVNPNATSISSGTGGGAMAVAVPIKNGVRVRLGVHSEVKLDPIARDSAIEVIGQARFDTEEWPGHLMYRFKLKNALVTVYGRASFTVQEYGTEPVTVEVHEGTVLLQARRSGGGWSLPLRVGAGQRAAASLDSKPEHIPY